MTRNIPKFASEDEEAQWWYDNREKHAEEFVAAGEEGRLRRGGMARRLTEAEKAKTVTIQLDDALRATRLAEEKGMEVNTYLAQLVHTALIKEIEATS